MSRRFLWRMLAALALVAAALGQSPSPSGAQTGPRIVLDRSEAGPGEPVLVSFHGFDSPFVNIVLCGNLGYRGATDCNMTAGVSKETLTGGRPKVVQLIAHPPPAHCPCLVRATASSGRDFAVAPIVIRGHPVGSIVGVSDRPLVEIEVEAREVNKGLWPSLRSALGGQTRYEATVNVRNITTEPLTRLALSGSVGHWLDDDAAVLDIEAPPALEPGQTWSRETEALVSPPSVGAYTFKVTASGAGSSVTTENRLSRLPLLFFLAAAVLLLDLVVMVWRWIARRLREADDRRQDAPGRAETAPQT